MKRDWLWDRRISLTEAKKILADPYHPKFITLAALLLSRKNNPKEVFQILSPVYFCQNWNKIKRRMRKDYWGFPRIVFWQAVFEKINEKLKEKKIKVLPGTAPKIERLLLDVGEKIRGLRKSKKMTQKDLAKKLKISQQLVSRIEQGKENISLLGLNNIATSLGASLRISLERK